MPDWLLPISTDAPCGASLEYDAEYAILLSRMTPRGEAQYGDFVGTSEAPNWAEIERDCRRLLLRTRDISLYVWICRARARLGQAAGLADGLAMLAAALQAWPEHIHPQLLIEGQSDPDVRANALAALADPEGLMSDVRDIVVASSTALRLAVRDVERAFAMPRPTDAPSPESVRRQLDALRASADAMAPVNLLAQAALHARAIDDWSKSQLGSEAPSLQGLTRVLDLFVVPGSPRGLDSEVSSMPEASQAGPPTMSRNALQAPIQWVPSLSLTGANATRGDVLNSIRVARDWFEVHEPSSPVAVLLKQAERMVGKRFSQVAHSIPLDLLQKWESEGEGAVQEVAR
ncbi:type VI secretion system ImpA family N-terminal domain-containing protein [Variovorax sp. J2P1-59]|uniref:type VI secretion system protein TssA n=1 Tax=Variovorax flavidus TaxID=3053501 RepID=UPI00257584AE|nr:type VI secretion system ImpA family N-terminal domain-containing protein [Variovorax sp. J2P1-59]MDM0074410.1 type VI secretion system ImpA family N-terminal domain-containing protein [Variovorax sp. J2P1-59]